MEVIHAQIFDVKNALFKQKASVKSKLTTVSCNNKDNCSLYKKGQCSLVGMFQDKCVYGKKVSIDGFTRKASKYNSWINDNKEQYKDVFNKLKSATKKMAIVGDYIYLPYSHLNMNKKLPFNNFGGFMNDGDKYMLLKDFTDEVIFSIITFSPQALMGGTIKSYAKEVVPDFITHIIEVFPDKVKSFLMKYPNMEFMFVIRSPIGRKALLESLKPGTVITKYHDSDKLNTQHWTWDGEYITSTDCGYSFSVVEFDTVEVKLKPKENTAVVITDKNQTDQDTIYID